MAKVLIVDDHPMVAHYTKREVLAIRPTATLEIALSLREATDLISRSGPPDYVLLDLLLPDCDGLAGLIQIRDLAPRAVVGVVTGETSPAVMQDAFAQGARGFITKSTGADEFTEALRKLIDHGFYYPPLASIPLPLKESHKLTRREVEVLRALAIGKSNKQLAPLLSITESTFKTYLRSIYEKLGARTRVAAVARAVELGIVDTRRRR